MFSDSIANIFASFAYYDLLTQFIFKRFNVQPLDYKIIQLFKNVAVKM